MNFKKLFLVMGLATATMTMSAQSVFDIKLYNGRPPYDNGDPNDSAKVRVFLPMEKQATGRAVVICPGGAYETLSMEKEGYDWGEILPEPRYCSYRFEVSYATWSARSSSV